MRYQLFRWLYGLIATVDNEPLPLQIKSEEEAFGENKKKKQLASLENAISPGKLDSVAIRTVPSANANAMGNAGSAEIVSNQIIRRREVLSSPSDRSPSVVSICHNYVYVLVFQSTECVLVCVCGVSVPAMNIKHALHLAMQQSIPIRVTRSSHQADNHRKF